MTLNHAWEQEYVGLPHLLTERRRSQVAEKSQIATIQFIRQFPAIRLLLSDTGDSKLDLGPARGTSDKEIWPFIGPQRTGKQDHQFLISIEIALGIRKEVSNIDAVVHGPGRDIPMLANQFRQVSAISVNSVGFANIAIQGAAWRAVIQPS